MCVCLDVCLEWKWKLTHNEICLHPNYRTSKPTWICSNITISSSRKCKYGAVDTLLTWLLFHCIQHWFELRKKKTDRLRQAIHFLDQHLFVCSYVGKVLVCTYIFHVFPLYISNKWVIYMGPPSGRRHLYTDQFHHIHTNRQINTSTHKCDARPSSMNDVRANIPSHRTPQFSHGNLYDILS